MSAVVVVAPRDLDRPPSRARHLRRTTPKLLGGAVLLGVLVWRVGDRPFVDAVRLTTWPVVVVAVALTFVTTISSALRWRLVASRLGVPISKRDALSAYYGSQLLNVVLPGGVLGDAHRAVRHGRASGDLSCAIRATCWERFAGKIVQTLLMLLVLAVIPTRVRLPALLIALGSVVLCLVVWLLLRRAASGLAVSLTGDVSAMRDPVTLTGILVTSAGSSLGHLALLAVAADAVGVRASWPALLPVGLVILCASSVPLNVAGWGMREGVTAWAFATVGLPAATGVTVAVLYGVLGTLAAMPGVVVLLVQARRGSRTRRPVEPQTTAV